MPPPPLHTAGNKLECYTQMLQILHMIRENLNKNMQTDINYVDFAKAFDSVDHGLILVKRKQYGACGRTFELFTKLAGYKE